MKRLLGHGFPKTPRSIGPVPAPAVHPRRIDFDNYEDIYFSVIGGRTTLPLRMADGTKCVKLTREEEEHYGIPYDPWRSMCIAMEGSRHVEVPDGDTMVWSYTTHANRDVILWWPDFDPPPRFDTIGKDILTSSLRPARNATLTQAGDRLYFRPLYGVLYVTGVYS